ncbi:dihydrofolate reductase [Capnocytophaga sp. ARDL2]|uniref:dihydrofolate reductase n=1 Tax=Capnocytophaga sp. ARDL2 TaxID=3238809 RepID=UPI003555E7D7
MQVALIAAVAKNHVIGKDNDLLWHLPEDFKFFKQTTTGHHIIMGRKTFESFPKLLPNRTHVVISRDKNYQVSEGVVLVHSIDEALEYCKEQNLEKVFVIGGAEIYRLVFPFADTLYITWVNTSLDGDAFFPQFDENDYHKTHLTKKETDDKHKYSFEIIEYTKK